MTETQMLGHLEYSGGSTAIIKDVQAAMMTGSLAGGGAAGTAGAFAAGATAGAAAAGAGAAVFGGIGWKAWSWVRDNLLDQHGCYISYLTRNGKPMDAGLGENSGVAVGQQHSITLLANSLRIRVPTVEGGRRRITSNELLTSLGWTPQAASDLQFDVSMFNDEINTTVLGLSQRNPDGTILLGVKTVYAEVTRVIDGDTFLVKPLSGDGIPYLNGEGRIRFGSVNTAEFGFKTSNIVGGPRIINQLDPNDAGFQAYDYVNKHLLNKTIALRINPTNSKDNFGRTVAWIFYYVPEEVSEELRKDFLMKQAGQWPAVEWDSFYSNGHARTLNWELVVAGLAHVDMRAVMFGIPAQGAAGAGGADPRVPNPPAADQTIPR